MSHISDLGEELMIDDPSDDEINYCCGVEEFQDAYGSDDDVYFEDVELALHAGAVEDLELMERLIENRECELQLKQLLENKSAEEEDITQEEVVAAPQFRITTAEKRLSYAKKKKKQLKTKKQEIAQRSVVETHPITIPTLNPQEQRSKSVFAGLGYQATCSRIAASKRVNDSSNEKRLSGSEWRKSNRDARLIEGEDMYAAFTIGRNAGIDESVILSADEYEEVFSVIDTGTTVSISGLTSTLTNMRRSSGKSIVGFNGSRTQSKGIGTALGYAVDVTGERFRLEFPDVHVVPGAPLELISVSKMRSLGYGFHFPPEGMAYMTTPTMRTVIMIERNGLFMVKWKRAVDPADMKKHRSMLATSDEVLFDNVLNCEDDDSACDDGREEEEVIPSSSSLGEGGELESFHSCAGLSGVKVNVKKKQVELPLLHRRLGHWHPNTITAMSNSDAFFDVTLSEKNRRAGHTCDTCSAVKATRNHVSNSRDGESDRKFTKPFQRVWSDVKGELPRDMNGNKYMVTFTCEVTRWCCVYFMKRKSEVKTHLRSFLKWLKMRGWKCEVLNTDGGGEYTANENAAIQSEFNKICLEENIEQQFTSPYTPAQNGISERMNRTLVEHAACLLTDARLAKRFWSLAVRHACYIRNRVYCSGLATEDEGQRSPYQVLYGKSPSIGSLKVFGCDVWRYNHASREDSFDPRALKGIFVGISSNRKGWMVYDLKSKKIRTSYHCSFNESFAQRKCNLTQFDLREHKAGPAASQKELEMLQLERDMYVGDDEVAVNILVYQELSKAEREAIEAGEKTNDPIEIEAIVRRSALEAVKNNKKPSNDDSLEADSPDNIPTVGGTNENEFDINDENSGSHDDPTVDSASKSGREEPFEEVLFEDPNQDDSIDEDNSGRTLRSREATKSSTNKSDDVVEDDSNSTQPQPTTIPLRTLEEGGIEPITLEQSKFINHAFDTDWPIAVRQKNPKKLNSKSRTRYEQYKSAVTLRQYIQFGGTWKDLFFDYERGYIVFLDKDDTQAEQSNAAGIRRKKLFNSDDFSSMTHEQSMKREFAVLALDHIESLPHSRQVQLKKALRGQSLVEYAYSCAAKITIEEPSTVVEALASKYAKEWRAAMDEEMSNLIKFGCFDEVDRDQAVKHGKLVRSKWVFKVKYNSDNTLQRFRARLVARGFTQAPGSDYFETFSPVFGYTSLRTILAHAAANDMQLDQWDLKNGFIQQDIDVPHMYLEYPEGYNNRLSDGRRAALHVRKSLYGFKQSSRLLHKRLSGHLIKLGFKQLISDQCVFTKGVGDEQVIVCVWVDDILMCTKRSNDVARKEFDFELRKEFEVSPWIAGEAGWILNMNVTRNWEEGTLQLTQEAAIEKLAKKFDLTKEHDAKPYVPMDPNLKLSKTPVEEVVPASEFDYMSAVGGLLYISMTTRPDISYATSVLSRYMSCPGVEHVKAAKRVIQYLYRTKTHGLIYSRKKLPHSVGAPHLSEVPELYVHTRKSDVAQADQYEDDQLLRSYCDADLAGDTETRRSTSGFCVILYGAVVHWSSKLQSTVALSTAEAETIAATEAIKQLIHMRLLLKELGCEAKYPTVMYEDNNAALAFSTKGEQSKRTKHYQMKVHFLSEQYQLGTYSMKKVPTNSQLADTFTKALPVNTFELYRDWMGVRPLKETTKRNREDDSVTSKKQKVASVKV